MVFRCVVMGYSVWWMLTNDAGCAIRLCWRLMDFVFLQLFGMKGLSEGEQLSRIFLVLVMYCWASLPLMYLCSFMFSIPSGGFTKMIMVNIITGKYWGKKKKWPAFFVFRKKQNYFLMSDLFLYFQLMGERYNQFSYNFSFIYFISSHTAIYTCRLFKDLLDSPSLWWCRQSIYSGSHHFIILKLKYGRLK